MNSFLKGILVGVGIGMIVAPMRGEEMRRLLAERFQEFRGYLPENEQMNQYVQQASDRVSQVRSNLSGLAQQTVSKVKDTSSSLSDRVQQVTSTGKQTSQDVADTAKPTTEYVKQNAQTGAAKSGAMTSGTPTSTKATATAAPFPSGYPEYTNPETH